ncbi:MAG: sulfurtransferase TusA family protein [bacterium]
MKVQDSMDLLGVPCPGNFARILLRLEAMDDGEILEVWIDDGEPFENVPRAVLEEGHDILTKDKQGEKWRLVIKRKSEGASAKDKDAPER